MAEGLERGNVSDTQKQHEYFRFIVQECRRLGSMIENVLDFSRIEQGRKEYQFEPTDLPKLVDQTVKLMEPYAAERQVNLATEIATNVGEVEVDGRAIQQALVNLIDNAIKHSPAGSAVRVVVDQVGRGVPAEPSGAVGRSVPAEPSGKVGRGVPAEPLTTQNHLSADASSYLRIAVQDQGPGIPAHERHKIFERFYRCGSELRRETQGVGIGLSIVKHIVDAHSGTIHVTSEPGEGTTFTIVLPSSKVGRDVPVAPSGPVGRSVPAEPSSRRTEGPQ